MYEQVLRRPALGYEPRARTFLDHAGEAAAIIGVAGSFIAAAVAWPGLPDLIPTHFDGNGQPNAWGGRWQLLVLPTIGVVLYTVLTVVGLLPTKYYNFPFAVTPQNAVRQQVLARRLLLVLKAECAWLFTWLTLEIIRSARTGTGTLTPAFVPVIIGLLAVTIGVYLVLAWRAR